MIKNAKKNDDAIEENASLLSLEILVLFENECDMEYFYQLSVSDFKQVLRSM